jgi:hypothetical protein
MVVATQPPLRLQHDVVSEQIETSDEVLGHMVLVDAVKVVEVVPGFRFFRTLRGG